MTVAFGGSDNFPAAINSATRLAIGNHLHRLLLSRLPLRRVVA
jgi:hypothetical protein